MNFVAIDFETAVAHHACSVGIVTVVNGEITDQYVQLIQPPNNEYFWRTIQVHGINPRDTQNSPNFVAVLPEILKRLEGKTIVAHNESFDRNVLLKSMAHYNLDYSNYDLPAKWECTSKIYKAKGYKPANLKACCDKNGIELNHHEALSDAVGCAKLYLLK